MQKKKEDVLEMLRCPKSGSALKLVGNRLVTESNDEDLEYEVIDGYAVLIDFENSVLKKDDVRSVSSVIERRSYAGLSGFVKRLVSPPQLVTTENIKHILELLFKDTERAQVLIVGGGSIGQGMQPLYDDPRVALVAFDIYASPSVQFVADGHSIPLPDSEFDLVIVQAVLEHVLEPDRVVAEIHRVLKNDGIVYSEIPFMQQVHEGAYDFTRYTESGHRYLFRKFGLIKSGATAGAGTQLLWSLDFFFRSLFRSYNVGKIVKLFFCWLQLLDKLIPDRYNIDSASGVFFLGKKRTFAISADEIVTHYKGAQQR